MKAEDVKPIMRWAGSKRRLLPALLARVPKRYSTYHEPFAGSSVLFLSLRPSTAELSDLNPGLINAYRIVKKNPYYLHELISRWRADGSDYYRVRGIEETHLTEYERAARFIYLNRFSFNGVYRTNRNGIFNVPRGTHTGDLPSLDELERFSKILRGVKLRCSDFEKSLKTVSRGDFVYLDPPYALPSKRDRGEYGPDSFRADDLGRLFDVVSALDRRGAKVLLSYARSRIIERTFSDFRVDRISVQRSVSGFSESRARVSEVLIRNY